MLRAMKPEDRTDLARFLEELQHESDRGLALVGGAVVDDKLRATLAAFFVECSAVAKLIDQGNAPLGAFSARADACLALGLIDDFEYSEINLVRKIRNEFAHGLHGDTLQH
jgi:mannitol operon repressor